MINQGDGSGGDKSSKKRVLEDDVATRGNRCDRCNKDFKTDQGLKVHLGKKLCGLPRPARQQGEDDGQSLQVLGGKRQLLSESFSPRKSATASGTGNIVVIRDDHSAPHAPAPSQSVTGQAASLKIDPTQPLPPDNACHKINPNLPQSGRDDDDDAPPNCPPAY